MGGSDTGRRLLAVGAVVCAVSGLVLAAGAMPMVASESPANDVFDRSSDGTPQESERSAGPSDADLQRPGDGDSGDLGDRDRADGSGTNDEGQRGGGMADNGADALPKEPPGAALVEYADSADNPLFKGVLYGLGALTSLLGGDSTGAQPGSAVGDANATADVPAGTGSRLAASTVGGAFGELLAPSADAARPDAVGESRPPGQDPDAVIDGLDREGERDGSGNGTVDGDGQTPPDGTTNGDGTAGGRTDHQRRRRNRRLRNRRRRPAGTRFRERYIGR